MKELREISNVSDHVLESRNAAGGWVAKVIICNHSLYFEAVDDRVKLTQNTAHNDSLGNKRDPLIMRATDLAQHAYDVARMSAKQPSRAV